MEDRLKKELKKHLPVFLLGIVYFVFIRLSGFCIPCPFRLLTGFLCPGCGITSMVLAVARLDISEAFRCHPVLFVTLPVLLAVYIAETARYIKSGERKWTRADSVVVRCEIVLLVLYGIVRNIV